MDVWVSRVVTWFFLVLMILGNVQCTCGPWIPIDPFGIPHFTGTIRVWNLLSALLECTEDGLLTALNGYHGGIGFEVLGETQNYSYSVNFDAFPTFEGAIFPSVEYLLDGSVNLQWSSGGKVFIYEGINLTYWDPVYGSKVIGEINGTMFTQYLQYIYDFNNTNPYYDILSVYTYFPLRPWDTVWISAHECFSFVWESYRWFYVNYGVIFKEKSGRQSVLAILSSKQPIKVNMENPIEKKMVNTFYEILAEKVYEQKYTAIIDIVREVMINHRWFLHHAGEYYFIQPEFPFLDTYFFDFPFPPYDDESLSLIQSKA